MSGIEKKVFMEMIEGDLQLAWELFNDERYDLGVHHFESATEKAKQLRDMAKNEPPQPQQPVLDV